MWEAKDLWYVVPYVASRLVLTGRLLVALSEVHIVFLFVSCTKLMPMMPT